jgi:hypothetical protein
MSSIAATALLLASCGVESRPPVSVEVSKVEWQKNAPRDGLWPFTVDSGVLTCHAPDWVTLTANGTEYALSDNARWIGKYPSVSPILVKGYVEVRNERQPVPTTFDVVTERGRELCR